MRVAQELVTVVTVPAVNKICSQSLMLTKTAAFLRKSLT